MHHAIQKEDTNNFMTRIETFLNNFPPEAAKDKICSKETSKTKCIVFV